MTDVNKGKNTFTVSPQKTEKFQTTGYNNQILVNTISQLCKHMIGEYSLECYSERHVLNIVKDFKFDYISCTYSLVMG